MDAIAEYGDDQVAEYGPVEDLWRAGRSTCAASRRRPAERSSATAAGSRCCWPSRRTSPRPCSSSTRSSSGSTGQAPDPDLGVLAAAPNHHQLDFHVIADDTLLPSLNLIAAVGAVGHSDDAAALTPDVYWWHHGRLERLTTVHEGRIRVDATGEFGKVLEQVGGEPPPSPYERDPWTVRPAPRAAVAHVAALSGAGPSLPTDVPVTLTFHRTGSTTAARSSPRWPPTAATARSSRPARATAG